MSMVCRTEANPGSSSTAEAPTSSTAMVPAEEREQGKLRLTGEQTEIHEWYSVVQQIASAKGMGIEGAKEICRSTEEAVARKHIVLTLQQKRHLTALQLAVQARPGKDGNLDLAQSIIRFQVRRRLGPMAADTPLRRSRPLLSRDNLGRGSWRWRLRSTRSRCRRKRARGRRSGLSS